MVAGTATGLSRTAKSAVLGQSPRWGLPWNRKSVGAFTVVWARNLIHGGDTGEIALARRMHYRFRVSAPAKSLPYNTCGNLPESALAGLF